MEFKDKKKYYNNCDPYKPLAPNEPFNLDIDREKEKVRGLNWVEELAGKIQFSEGPECCLFTGMNGSGKTTELKRLLDHLEKEADLFPVYADAVDLLDLTTPIDVTDILAAVVYSAERQVAVALGKDPEKALEDGYMKRLSNWMKSDATLKQTKLTVPGGSEWVFELKANPTLRQKIRETLALHLSKFIKEAKEELEVLNNTVREKLNKDGIIIILDSLERLRGTGESWPEVVESAVRVFTGETHYLKLPVHVIYTVPSYLATRIPSIEFLPMLKVRDREGKPFQPGLEVARKLVKMRIGETALEYFLGADFDNKLDMLSLSTGGYLREILVSLQNIIRSPEPLLSNEDFEAETARLDDKYRMIVPDYAFDWLAKVHVSMSLVFENDEHREIADEMLGIHAVQRYKNRNYWYALHPSVAKIPGIEKRIEELRTENNREQ